jgi:exonuclease III
MKLISLNLRFGGQNRTDSILDYLIKSQPDFIVLGEFKNDANGEKIKEALKNEGFYFEESKDDVLGVLVASKHPFTLIETKSRWVEIELLKHKLRILGVYVPTGSNNDKKFKDEFWQEILKYAMMNQETPCILTGDFNSCGKEDTTNLTYSAKELKELLELNWLDSWASYKNDDSERYTWFSNAGNGFRLDYAFLSPKLGEQVEVIAVSHDSKIREEGISDHSPIHIKFNFDVI